MPPRVKRPDSSHSHARHGQYDANPVPATFDHGLSFSCHVCGKGFSGCSHSSTYSSWLMQPRYSRCPGGSCSQWPARASMATAMRIKIPGRMGWLRPWRWRWRRPFLYSTHNRAYPKLQRGLAHDTGLIHRKYDTSSCEPDTPPAAHPGSRGGGRVRGEGPRYRDSFRSKLGEDFGSLHRDRVYSSFQLPASRSTASAASQRQFGVWRICSFRLACCAHGHSQKIVTLSHAYRCFGPHS